MAREVAGAPVEEFGVAHVQDCGEHPQTSASVLAVHDVAVLSTGEQDHVPRSRRELVVAVDLKVLAGQRG